MRRFPSSWSTVLTKLGYRRTRQRAEQRTRRSRIESLEERAMLSISPPAPDEPVSEVVGPLFYHEATTASLTAEIQPEFVVADASDGADQFEVRTEYGQTGEAKAIVTLHPDLESIDYSLQRIVLELRLGSQVLERHEVLIDLAESAFLSDFLSQRSTIAESEGDPTDAAEIAAWLSLIDSVGEFSDLDTNLPGEAGREAEREALSRLRAIAGEERRIGGVIDVAAEKTNFYRSLTARAQAVENNADPEERASQRRSLGGAAASIAARLAGDLASGDPSVASAAAAARDDLLATVDPYYTVLAGLQKNQTLRQQVDGLGRPADTVYAVDEGVLAPPEGPRVELGEHVGLVQIRSNWEPATAALLAEVDASLPALQDAWLDEANGLTNYNDGTLSVGEVAGAERHAVVEFDLSPYTHDIPAAAEVTFTTQSPTSSVDVELDVHSDLWGAGQNGSAWDESTITWDEYDGGLSAGFDTPVHQWTISAAGPQTADVTEWVQRALVLGDSNLNADYDVGGATGDVEAFYLAVHDFTEYVAQFGANEVPGFTSGLVYRNDANLDGAIDAADASVYFSRLGHSQGDFNLDGVVDLYDYALWSENLGALASRYAEGDADFSGVIDATDYSLWDADIGYASAGPTDPSLIFRLSGATTGEVVFESSESGTSPPELNIDFEPTVRITDFTADGDNFQLTFDVEYDDATNAQIAIYQVQSGVETLLVSGVSVDGAAGIGKTATIAPSGTITNPGEDFSLIARVSSDNGLTTDKSLDYGAFSDSSGNWFVFGTDTADVISATASALTLNSQDVTPSASGPVAVYVKAGAGADQVTATPSDATAIHLSGGSGDDTYAIAGATTTTASVSIRDTAGIDTLNLAGWNAGLSAGTPLDLTSTAAQTLSSSGGDAFNLSLGGAYTVELLSGVSLDSVAGPGYDAPITVSSAYDELDGDHRFGKLSLREALAIAKAIVNPFNSNGETIDFDPRMFDFGPAIIDLAAAGPNLGLGQLVIDHSVTINGPGAGLLTISGGGQSRILKTTAGAVSLSGLTIADGYTLNGAGTGIYSTTELTLEGVVVRDNYSEYVSGNTNHGGGIASYNANLTILGSSIVGNDARHGAGIYYSTLGAGGYNLWIENSTIANNYSRGPGQGGGLFVFDYGTTPSHVTLLNTTVSNNEANIGGGVHIKDRAIVDIIHSTITENYARQSLGGVRNLGAASVVTLYNSIVAGNDGAGWWAANDFEGPIDAASSHNLIGRQQNTGLSDGLNGNQVIVGADPGLAPLADNGGPTKTHALETGSPAIDAGDESLVTGIPTDQRGHLRVIDLDDDPNTGNVDIGAYEVQPPPIEIVDFRTENEQLVVDYIVHGAAARPLVVKLHASIDGVVYAGELDAVEITDPALWQEGTTHSFSFTPDFSQTDLEDEYFLVAGVAYNTGSLSNSDFRPLTSGLFVEADGTVQLHGTEADEAVTVTATQLISPLLLLSPYTLAAGAAVSVRTHGGDDTIDIVGFTSAAVDASGGSGDDTLSVSGSPGATIYGTDGDDTLVGDELDNSIYGGLGNDRIEGRGGDDWLRGEQGDDVYVFSDASDLGVDDIYDYEGNDTLDFSAFGATVQVDLGYYSLYTPQELSVGVLSAYIGGIENVIGTPYDDVITGSSDDNRIDGFGGADAIEGGLGNDTYVVRQAGGASASLGISDAGGVDFLDFSNWVGDAMPLDLQVAAPQVISPPWLTGDVSIDFAVGGEVELVVGLDGVTSGISAGYGNELLVTEFVDVLDGADMAPGAGLTLREALAIAKADDGPNTITFDLGGQTEQGIQLSPSLGRLVIEGGDTSIIGPGREALSISGGSQTGVLLVPHGVVANVSGVAIRDGNDTLGGGVLSYGTLSLASTLIADNQSLGGGGLYGFNSDTTITSSLFTGNEARIGGGVAHNGRLTVEDSDFIGNTTAEYGTYAQGGGLSLGGAGSAEIRRTRIIDNLSEGFGGGLFVYGLDEFLLIDSVVAHNQVGTDSGVYLPIAIAGVGGGVAIGATTTSTISGSTIHSNSAYEGIGGGIVSDWSNGVLSIANTTISSNNASSGGGLYLGEQTEVNSAGLGAVTLTNVTVVNNTATTGVENSGIWSGGGGVLVGPDGQPLTLYNTIVADNTNGAGGASDIHGAVQDASSHNLLGPGLVQTPPPSVGELLDFGESSGLAPLDNYGGLGQSHALLPGSPAIDAADSPLAGPVDQRGYLRPRDGDGVNGAAADIGAFEYRDLSELVVDTTADAGVAPGRLSLRQALALARELPGLQTISFSPSVFYEPQTITLDYDAAGDGDSLPDPLVLDSDVIIVGPGDDLLTIVSGDAGRVFTISAAIEASLAGFAIANAITLKSQDNTIPVAASEHYITIADGETMSVSAEDGLLANDYDDDGGPQELQIQLLESPTSGAIVLNADGSFDYTPSIGFIGVDRFLYRVFDGFAFSEPRHVSINVREIGFSALASSADTFVYNLEEQNGNKTLHYLAGSLGNHGFQENLYVWEGGDDHYSSFLQFDLDLYNSPVLTTQLEFTPTSIGTPDDDIGLYTADYDTWAEGDDPFATSADYALIPGSLFANIDVNELSSGVPLSFDTTTIAQQSLQAGDSKLTFAILPSSGSSIFFASREHSNESYRPRLIIQGAASGPVLFVQNERLTLPEDADVSTDIRVADLIVFDPLPAGYEFTLSPVDDHDSFVISGQQLYLKSGTALDFETHGPLQVTVVATDPETGLSDSLDLTFTIEDVNEKATVDLQNVPTGISEDTDLSSGKKVADVVIGGDALGTDKPDLIGPHASLFQLVNDNTELWLKAGTALDYEALGGNHELSVTVTVDDPEIAGSPDHSTTLILPVLDANEAPVISLSNVVTTLSEAANATGRVRVANFSISDDALGALSAPELIGPDAAFFEIEGQSIYLLQSAVLDALSSPLDFTLRVEDPGAALSDEQPLSITVVDAAVNAPASVALANELTSVSESLNTSIRRKVADILVTDDGLGVNVLSLSGANADLFEIVGYSLYLRAGVTLNAGGGNLSVDVNVDDASFGVGINDTATLPLVVLPGVTSGLYEDAYELNDVFPVYMDPATPDLPAHYLGSIASFSEDKLTIFDGVLNGADVVFVIDVSGSARDPFEGATVGNVNEPSGDALSNTILDAELAAALSIVQQLRDANLPQDPVVSIVTYSTSATRLDLNPLTGVTSTVTTVSADLDGMDGYDVDHVLRSINGDGYTNYEAALSEAKSAVDEIAGNGTNVIFFSDGQPNVQGVPNADGLHQDEAADLRATGANVRAFGVGANVPLDQLLLIDPNADRFESASELNALFDGVSSDDVDYFRFTAAQTGSVVIRVDFDNSKGDLDLEVRDGSDSWLASSTSMTADFEEILLTVAAGQEYVVKVTGADNLYSLTIALDGSLLIEETYYAKEYRQAVTVDPGSVYADASQSLEFRFEDLVFDTTDKEGIPDAFEFALLNSDGKSAVASIDPSYEAFFNITEGQGARLASGVAYDEVTGTVVVDVSHLSDGVQLELVARLVNTDGLPGDTDTTTRVRVIPGVTQSDTPSLIPGAGRPDLSIDYGPYVDLDLSAVSDVTVGFDIDYELSTLNDDTNTHYAKLSLTNNGLFEVRDSLLIGIKSPTKPITLANADGVTSDGIPYIDVSGRAFAPGNLWNRAGDSTSGIELEVFNPLEDRFDFELVVLGRLNQAPEFENSPRFFDAGERLVEVPLGVAWNFDANAVDTDKDDLTYSVDLGPVTLDDAATGEVSWITTDPNDVGKHFPIRLRVEDGHGGSDELEFTLVVTDPAANRAPEFEDEPPVVEAYVNTRYEWTATAFDIDGDSPLYFRLNPAMTPLDGVNEDDFTINESTGVITWTPRPEDVDKTYRIQLEVWDRDPDGSDPLKLWDDLEFDLRVFSEPGNQDPYFTSYPGTEGSPFEAGHIVVADATPNDTDPVNPDSINLDLEAGEQDTRRLSVTLPANGDSADIVLVVDESHSMADAHTWLGDIIEEIDSRLVSAGITNNRYALFAWGTVAYGYYTVEHLVPGEGGNELRKFVDAATIRDFIVDDDGPGPNDQPGLHANESGLGQEDGFLALQQALEDFTITDLGSGEHPDDVFRANAARSFVLITDEGRENLYEWDDTENPSPFGEDADLQNLKYALAQENITVDSIVRSFLRSSNGNKNLGEFQTGDFGVDASSKTLGAWSVDPELDAYVSSPTTESPVSVSAVEFDVSELNLYPLGHDPSVDESDWRGEAVVVAELGIEGSAPALQEDSASIPPDVFVAYDYYNTDDFRWIGFTAGSKWLKWGSYEAGAWSVVDGIDLTQEGFTPISAGEVHELRFELGNRWGYLHNIFFDGVAVGGFGSYDPTDGVTGTLTPEGGLVPDNDGPLEKVGVGVHYREGFEEAIGRFESFGVFANLPYTNLDWGPFGRVLFSQRFGDFGGSEAIGVAANRADGEPTRGFLPSVLDNAGQPQGSYVIGEGGESDSEWYSSWPEIDEYDSIDQYVDLAWGLGGSVWDISYLIGATPDATLLESFTEAFVANQVEDALDRLLPKVESTNPTFVGYSEVTPGVIPAGGIVEFDVHFEGDGNPHAQFDLDIVQSIGVGVDVEVGSVPVTINAPYIYDLDAIDPDGDKPLLFGFAEGSNDHGAVIDADKRLVWDAAATYWEDVADPQNPTPIDYTFDLVVTDGRGGVGQQSMTVTVSPPPGSNAAPTFDLLEEEFPLVDINDPSGPRKVDVTESGSFHVYRELSFVIPASDPDVGDTPRFQILGAAPELMTIDRNTGEAVWTPGPADIGENSFTVRITDGRGGVAEQEFIIDVEDRNHINSSPILLGEPAASLLVGETLRYDFNHVDIQGDRVRYYLVSGPEGMAIDEETGELRWKPNKDQIGHHDYVIAVKDSENAARPRSFSIDVTHIVDGRFDFRVGPPNTIAPGLNQTYFVPVEVVDLITDRPLKFVPQLSTLPDETALYLPDGPWGAGFYWQPSSDTYSVGDQTEAVELVFRLDGLLAVFTVNAIQVVDLGQLTVGPAAPTPGNPELYSIGEPSAEEQLMLEIINRARADATAEATRLKNLHGSDPDVTAEFDNRILNEPSTTPTPNTIEQEFADNISSQVGYLEYFLNSSQPLSFNKALLDASAYHSIDIATSGPGADPHSSSADPPPVPDNPDYTPVIPNATAEQRLASFGYTGSIAENFDGFGNTVEHSHARFEYDWGVPSRGHRISLHMDVFKEIGIGIIHDPDSQLGEQVITQDFGSSGPQAFITGVVYEDRNANDFYDVGEGLGGVRVDVLGASYYAVTSASGGYSIPVSSDSNYEVAFSREGLGSVTQYANVVGLKNAKVDWDISDLGVENASPVLKNFPRTRVAVGQQWSYSPVVMDPDGDVFTTLQFEMPDWAAELPGEPGVFVGTPGPEHLGYSYEVKVTAEDGRGGALTHPSFWVTVEGDVHNTPPSVVDEELPWAVVDREYRVKLSAEDTDNDVVTWNLLQQPNDPTIGFDPNTGEIVWTPTEDYLGDNDFVVVATDGVVATPQHHFKIKVRGANTDARLVDVGPPEQIVAGEPFEFFLTAFDPDALEGELRFAVESGPYWLKFNSESGRVWGTPPAIDYLTSDIEEITVSVTDGQPSSTPDEETFSIEVLPAGTVINQHPIIENAPVAHAYVNQDYVFTPVVIDPEGGAATWSLVESPQGMADNGVDVQWQTEAATPGQTHYFTIEVVDPVDASLTHRYRYSVLLEDRPSNAKPVIDTAALPTGSDAEAIPGATYQTVVRAQDSDGDRPTFLLDDGPAGATMQANGLLTWQVPLDATPGTTVDFSVIAVDRFGEALPPEVFTVTLFADDIPPVAALIASETVIPTGGEITFQSAATDNVGIASQWLTVSSNPLTTTDDTFVTIRADGTASHLFLGAGEYEVTLHVVELNSSVEVTSDTITIQVINPAAVGLLDAELDWGDDGLIDTGHPVGYSFDVTYAGPLDTNTIEWRLELWTSPEGPPEIVADGIGTAMGVSGVFDPLARPDGLYQLQLVAEIPGVTLDYERAIFSVDTGGYKVGQFALSFTDLAIPVGGIPLSFTRSYDSAKIDTAGDFGPGWTLGLLSDAKIEYAYTSSATGASSFRNFNAPGYWYEGSEIHITLPGGQTEGFRLKTEWPGGLPLFIPQTGTKYATVTTSWEPIGGTTSSLAVEYDAVYKYQITANGAYSPEAGAVLLDTNDLAPYSPIFHRSGNQRKLLLTTADGYTFSIGTETGRIDSIEAPDGSKIKISGQNLKTWGAEGNLVSASVIERGFKNRIERIIQLDDPTSAPAYNDGVLVNGRSVEYRYDRNGDLVEIVGLDGEVTTLEYNVTDESPDINHPHFLTRITDPTGVRTLEARFEDNKLVGIVDASGEFVELEHEEKYLTLSNNDVVLSLWIDRATDPLDQPTEIARDGKGNVRRTLVRVEEVREGAEVGGDNDIANDIYQVTVFDYDYANRLIGQSQSFQRTYAYAYTALTQADIDAIVDPTVRDLQDVEPLFSEDDDSTFQYWVSRTDYDSRGNITRQQDAEGNVTLLQQYTEFGEPRRVIDPAGNVTVNAYEGDDTPHTSNDDTDQLLSTSIRDADGKLLSETRYEYDERFGGVTRVVQIDDAGNQIEVGRTEYDDKGRPVRSTDADGVTQHAIYDEDGNPTLSFSYWNQPDELTGLGVGVPEQLIVTRTYYDAAGRATETRQYTIDAAEFPAVSGVSELSDASQLDNYAYDWSTTTTYDKAGRTTASTDRYGRTTETRYNVRGQVVETRTDVVDEVGDPYIRVNRTFYDINGRAVATSDPFLLDANDGVTIVTPIEDLRASYSVFDTAGRVIERKRLAGETARITVSAGPKAGFWQSTFDEAAAKSAAEGDDDFLSSTLTEYDDRGRVFKTTSATGVETFPVYDFNGRQTETLTAIDLNGDGFVDAPSQYGGDGDLTATAELIRTKTEFDGAGRQILSTDALGNNTRLIYDSAGRVIRTIFDDFTEGSTVYDRLGNRVAEIVQIDTEDQDNPVFERRDFEYDDSGRQTAVLLPAINIDNPANPGVGDTISVRPRYEYRYDQYGNHTTIITSAYQQVVDGVLSSLVVYLRKDEDGVDQVAGTRDIDAPLIIDLGEITATRLTYDHLGRQTSRTLPISSLTETMVYNDRSLADLAASPESLASSVGLGQTEYMVDFEGRVTAYRYDNTATGGGRQVAMHYYPTLGAYLADRPDGQLDASAESVTYEYDAYGRQAAETFRRESGPPEVTTREFDAEGRTTSVTSPEGTVRYEYDALGRKTRTYTGGEDDTHTSAELDGKAVTDTRYTYDKIGRLKTVGVYERFDQPLTNPEFTTYTYDKNGNLDQMEMPGNVVTDYVYDDLNRLDLQTTFYDANDNDTYDAGDTLFASYDYEVRDDGKRVAVDEVNDLGHETRYEWEYDSLGRLVKETYDAEGDQYDYIDTFAFDVASNRIETKRDGGVDGDIGGPAEATTTYKYDANDRLTEETLDHTDNTKDRFTEYGFEGTTQVSKSVYRGLDNSGNKVEETTLEYNHQGRMSRTVVTKFAEDGVAIASQDTYEYEYNSRGIRVSQTVNGKETVYLLDLQNHTGYAQVLEEYVDGVLTKTYTLGHDVLAVATADQVLYLLTDGHGSTRAVYDLAALLANPDNPAVAILQRFAYDAHGALLPGTALVAEVAEALVNHLYSGEQTDLTGLQYLRARYYNPSTGRFNRLDPFFGNLDDPLSLHKYLYVHGDPINGIDPTGEFLGLGLAATLLLAGGVGAAFTGIGAYAHGASPLQSWLWAAGGFVAGALLAIGGLLATAGLIALAGGSAAASFLIPYTLGVVGIIGAGFAVKHADDHGTAYDQYASRVGILAAWAGKSYTPLGSRAVQQGYVPQPTVKSGSLRRIPISQANTGYGKPPYKGGFAWEFETTEETLFVRLHGSNNRERPWVMRAEDYLDASPEELRSLYALPDTPTRVSWLRVPPGVTVRAGIAREQLEWGGRGGGYQYEIRERVQSSWFFSEQGL